MRKRVLGFACAIAVVGCTETPGSFPPCILSQCADDAATDGPVDASAPPAEGGEDAPVDGWLSDGSMADGPSADAAIR